MRSTIQLRSFTNICRSASIALADHAAALLTRNQQVRRLRCVSGTHRRGLVGVLRRRRGERTRRRMARPDRAEASRSRARWAAASCSVVHGGERSPRRRVALPSVLQLSGHRRAGVGGAAADEHVWPLPGCGEPRRELACARRRDCADAVAGSVTDEARGE
jgi:hypothetical protein